MPFLKSNSLTQSNFFDWFNSFIEEIEHSDWVKWDWCQPFHEIINYLGVELACLCFIQSINQSNNKLQIPQMQFGLINEWNQANSFHYIRFDISCFDEFAASVNFSLNSNQLMKFDSKRNWIQIELMDWMGWINCSKLNQTANSSWILKLISRKCRNQFRFSLLGNID